MRAADHLLEGGQKVFDIRRGLTSLETPKNDHGALITNRIGRQQGASIWADCPTWVKARARLHGRSSWSPAVAGLSPALRRRTHEWVPRRRKSGRSSRDWWR